MMKPKQLNAGSIQKMQEQKVATALKDAKLDACESCKNTEFIQIYSLPRIPGLMVGVSKDVVAPQLLKFACSQCGRPWENKEEKPDEGKSIKDN